MDMELAALWGLVTPHMAVYSLFAQPSLLQGKGQKGWGRRKPWLLSAVERVAVLVCHSRMFMWQKVPEGALVFRGF